MSGRNFVGLDIGGTHISAVVLSDKLKILSRKTVNTPSSKSKFIGTIKFLVSKPGLKSPIVGIAVAGIVNGNTLKKAPNIPFLKNFDFQNVFQKQEKIILDNDARAFLKGELNFGKVSKKSRTIGVTIGTGIGRAFGVGKNVNKIKQFEYPEQWEKQYQKSKNSRNYKKMIDILADGLAPLIKKYRPNLIVLGGGVILNKKQKVTVPLVKIIKKFAIGKKIRISKLGAIAGAYGSALNAKNYFKK
jgi:predicted NBD/HSP70 family sugar kinase